MSAARGLALVTLSLAVAAHGVAAQVTVTAVAGLTSSALAVNGAPEKGSGLWYGGQAVVALGMLTAEATGLRGTLTPPSGSAGFERTGGEIRAIVGVRPLSWLAIEGGYTVRAFDSPAGYQKWTTTSVGARVSTQLGVAPLRGYARAAYVLGATVSGRGASNVGIAFEAGVRLLPQHSGAAVNLFYRFERYDFPNSGTPVFEHFEMLGLSLGLKLGR